MGVDQGFERGHETAAAPGDPDVAARRSIVPERCAVRQYDDPFGPAFERLRLVGLTFVDSEIEISAHQASRRCGGPAGPVERVAAGRAIP